MGFFDMFPKEMIASGIDQARLESERKAGRDAAIAAAEAEKAEKLAKEQRDRTYEQWKWNRDKKYDLWKIRDERIYGETKEEDEREYTEEREDFIYKRKKGDTEKAAKLLASNKKELKRMEIDGKNKKELIKNAIEANLPPNKVNELSGLSKKDRDRINFFVGAKLETKKIGDLQASFNNMLKDFQNGTAKHMPLTIVDFKQVYKPLFQKKSPQRDTETDSEYTKRISASIHKQYSTFQNIADRNEKRARQSAQSKSGSFLKSIQFTGKNGGKITLDLPNISQQLVKEEKLPPKSKIISLVKNMNLFDSNFKSELEQQGISVDDFFKDTNNVQKLGQQLGMLRNQVNEALKEVPDKKGSFSVEKLFPFLHKEMTKLNSVKKKQIKKVIEDNQPVSTNNVSPKESITQETKNITKNPDIHALDTKFKTSDQNTFMPRSLNFEGPRADASVFFVDTEKVKKQAERGEEFKLDSISQAKVDLTDSFNKWKDSGFGTRYFPEGMYQNLKILEDTDAEHDGIARGIANPIMALGTAIAYNIKDQEITNIPKQTASEEEDPFKADIYDPETFKDVKPIKKVYLYGELNAKGVYESSKVAKSNLQLMKTNTQGVKDVIDKTLTALIDYRKQFGSAGTGFAAETAQVIEKTFEESSNFLQTMRGYVKGEKNTFGTVLSESSRDELNTFNIKMQKQLDTSKRLLASGKVEDRAQGAKLQRLTSLKIQLAYTMSGMLQGEGSGGRTISDNDLKYALLVVGGTESGMELKLRDFQEQMDIKLNLIKLAQQYDRYGILDKIDQRLEGYLEQRKEEVKLLINNLQNENKKIVGLPANVKSSKWGERFISSMDDKVTNLLVQNYRKKYKLKEGQANNPRALSDEFTAVRILAQDFSNIPFFENNPVIKNGHFINNMYQPASSEDLATDLMRLFRQLQMNNDEGRLREEIKNSTLYEPTANNNTGNHNNILDMLGATLELHKQIYVNFSKDGKERGPLIFGYKDWKYGDSKDSAFLLMKHIVNSAISTNQSKAKESATGGEK